MKSLIRVDYSPSSFLLYSVLLLFAINLFVISSGICLWDDDEAAYAGFGLRMIETGDWVNPQFTWSDVHRKTPFHFWTIAFSFKIFGVNEFAVRFPSALAVFLTAITILYLVPKIWNKKTAKWAAIVFCGNFLCVSMGKMSLTDAWLMFFGTIAVLSLFIFIKKPAVKWNLLFWLSISFGILVKGPPIIILTGGIWLGIMIFSEERKKLIGTHPWLLGPVSLLPFLLWVYLSYQKDGGKLVTFLYEWYVLQRIGGSVFGQTGPPGYHFVVAIIAFVPWLPFFFSAVVRVFRNAMKDVFSIGLFLWFVFGWIFYELMSSKLPSYAMGAHPAFAIATATVLVSYVSDTENSRKVISFYLQILMVFIWIVLAAGISLAFYFLFPDYFQLSFLISVPLLLISLTYFFLSRQNKVLASVVFSMFSLMLIWGIAGSVLDYTPLKGSRNIVNKMKAYSSKYGDSDKINSGMVGFSARQLRMSFPFYLEQNFKEVKELNTEQAMEAVKGNDKIILLLGTDAIPIFKKAIEEKKLPETIFYEEVVWQSVNDQFKVHPFVIMHNFQSE